MPQLSIARHLTQPHGDVPPSWQRKVWNCVCGQPVFFRNSHCLKCHSELGYLPGSDEILTLDPLADGTWRVRNFGFVPHFGAPLRRCANFSTDGGCNWLVTDGADYCVACRLNRTIPDLSMAQNGEHWHKIEVAKRRLIAQLINVGLPIVSKGEDPARGLAFDFLAPDANGRPKTGHCDGIITINVLEASDVYREEMRTQFGEPYRTVLGHLRHEIGHYYWYRLVENTPWHAQFRSLFGDEREDYEQALSRHYAEGGRSDWHLNCVSAYASVHPWEDWAESWAHYLHVNDAVDTAIGFGMDPHRSVIEFHPFTREALSNPLADDAEDFLWLINGWVQLAMMLNELSRSLGQHDFYPFVLSVSAVQKLHFIHSVIAETAARR